MAAMIFATSAYRRADLIADLRVLRKGRGAQRGQSLERIGSTLRVVAGVTEVDRSTLVWDKVADWLRDRIALLPPELRISAMAAYGLDPEVALRLFQDRVSWLARRLDRDERTVRRRINEALERLVDLAEHGPDTMGGLRECLDQPVEIGVAVAGVADDDEMVWRCHVLTVARDVDNTERFFAVVGMLEDQARTVAVPLTRIRWIQPIND